MDGAVIGEDCVVGAGALVTERTSVPPKSLILGAPAKVKRPVTAAELAWIRESANNYVDYARQYRTDPLKPGPGFKMYGRGRSYAAEAPTRMKQTGFSTMAVG